MESHLAILTVAALLFALIFGIVYLKSRENMALIERGINPKINSAQPKPFVNLKYGLLLTGAGMGLIAAYLIDSVIMKHGQTITDAHGFNHLQDDNSPAIYFALIAIGGGLGLILSYAVEKKHWLDKIKKEPGE
jgi:hypothetical protein